MDSDEYIEEVLRLNKLDVQKTPSSKVPPVNLQKLAFDRKTIPIKLEIRVSEDLVIRDRFDWDLNELQCIRPLNFCWAIVSLLDIKNKEEEVAKLNNSILDQILEYIEKNTFFPRNRFCKREEEIIAEGQICVNCDSLLVNAELCDHCGFSYEKKFPSIEKKGEDFTITTRHTERQKIIEETKRKIVPSINVGVTYHGKEKKVCKNCGEINPFYLNECRICRYKFPLKTKYQKIATGSYCLYFWDLLCKDSDFIPYVDAFNEHLKETDYRNSYILYNRLKDIINYKPIHKDLEINEAQLKKLNMALDYNFNLIITSNAHTKQIFSDSAYEKLHGKYRNPEDDILNFDNITVGPELLAKDYDYKFRPSQLEPKLNLYTAKMHSSNYQHMANSQVAKFKNALLRSPYSPTFKYPSFTKKSGM